MSVAYTQSSGSIHYYQIELHEAAAENGIYSLQATSNDSTASPVIFQYQPTGSWFKARGRNCSTAARTGCGTWSDWSAAISPPTYLFLTQLDSSIEPRQIVPVSGWVLNLNTSSSYTIRVTAAGSGIGFNSDCTDNQEVITVPASSSYYKFIVPLLFACDAPAGLVTATLLSGTTTVYTTNKLVIGPVSVQVDNPIPESSDVADDDSTVTMTAATNVADTVTLSYQWQQKTGDVWSNDGAVSSSAQKSVTSTARGTRTYRVVVRHSSGASVESSPTYVTWDEWAIITDMVTALRTAVTGDVTYVSAQTALVTCVNTTSPAPTPLYASFDDILDGYTGATKTKMETGGTCGSQATTMFTANQDLHRSKLATLKTGSSVNALEYAALLETPQGMRFEANLADSDTLKRLAFLGATVGEPGSLVKPLYTPTSSTGASGQGDSPPPVSVRQGTGMACLPTNVNGARLTLSNKLLVLNCLVFDTPHSFWVKGDASSREAKQLKREIDSPTGRYAWLKRGDWKCSSIAPQGPVPSCLKHDVAYASLQKFAGGDAVAPLGNDPDGSELDEAWNPRNKSLADEKFRADILRNGCQDQSGSYAFSACLAGNDAVATVFFNGVAKRNHKGWPVTNADINDFTSSDRFKVCSEPVVPTVSGLTISKSGDIITASWDFKPGCVRIALTEVKFGVDWYFGDHPAILVESDPNSCAANGDRLTCAFRIIAGTGTIITKVSIFVIPREKEYGGDNYGGEGNNGRRYTAYVGPFVFN